jgi:hypothetical protein
MKKVLNYFARTLSILILIFFSIFIFEGLSPEFKLVDSLLHLLMSLIIFGAAIVSWKWPQKGGWIFIVLGIIAFFFFYTSVNTLPSIIIACANILTGVLFLYSSSKS